MNKVEEQMSLSELIEFAWKNDIRNQVFYYSNGGGAGVRFDKDGDFTFYNRGFVQKSDTFTVYIEDIDRETEVFDKVLYRNILGDFREVENFSVKKFKSMAYQVYLMEGDKVGDLLWTKSDGFLQ
ncbi:hypothetical protein [Mammaliicoccus virus vB_MscM-PMS2]|nr:hypothetical protein [Mammaliicoccus virus vB_MscM-PMS2]